LINCFVIDSEEHTANTIKAVLKESLEITFLGLSLEQDDALNSIIKKAPDVIFLNIDDMITNLSEFMFDVYQYSENKPVFIALSKSKNYAFDAYRYDFFDYLLKPITELSVRKCLMRYQKKHPIEKCDKICLKSYKDYQYLHTDEILFLKADNNTTDFYMKDGSVIGAFKTLRTFEDILPQNFLRIHKSYIINSDYVSRIQYGKSICTINRNNFHIPFSKTFIDNVELMNNTLYQSSLLSQN